MLGLRWALCKVGTRGRDRGPSPSVHPVSLDRQFCRCMCFVGVLLRSLRAKCWTVLNWHPANVQCLRCRKPALQSAVHKACMLRAIPGPCYTPWSHRTGPGAPAPSSLTPEGPSVTHWAILEPVLRAAANHWKGNSRTTAVRPSRLAHLRLLTQVSGLGAG